MKPNDMIALLDTSIATRNLGDQIIMSAVRRELLHTLPQARIIPLPTHSPVGVPGYKILRKARFAVVGGTNLLSRSAITNRQWKAGFGDAFFQRNHVFMGVGCWGYQKRPDFLTRRLYKALLSNRIVQSVRDEYTKHYLSSVGIPGVINTGCPTMWRLDSDHCAGIPRAKGDEVVVTLTDYRPDLPRDRSLLSQLRKSYRRLYLWPQGLNDAAYLKEVGSDGIEVIGPSLEAFDALLSSDKSLDYVGTRLHAGVRALQHRRRALIIAVDNRALEISKDTNLTVVSADAVPHLSSEVRRDWVTELELPWSSIERWRSELQRKHAA